MIRRQIAEASGNSESTGSVLSVFFPSVLLFPDPDGIYPEGSGSLSCGGGWYAPVEEPGS